MSRTKKSAQSPTGPLEVQYIVDKDVPEVGVRRGEILTLTIPGDGPVKYATLSIMRGLDAGTLARFAAAVMHGDLVNFGSDLLRDGVEEDVQVCRRVAITRKLATRERMDRQNRTFTEQV